MESRKEKARIRSQAWRDNQPKKERKYTVCGCCSVDISSLHFNARYCSASCKRAIGRESERSHPDYHERRRKTNLRYTANNPESRKESSKKYRENNLEYYAARRAQRRATKLERTPAWVSKSSMDGMYGLARKITELTGVQMEVDHIVPLQGESISGLHVPWNLQLLTQTENRKKGNRQ